MPTISTYTGSICRLLSTIYILAHNYYAIYSYCICIHGFYLPTIIYSIHHNYLTAIYYLPTISTYMGSIYLLVYEIYLLLCNQLSTIYLLCLQIWALPTYYYMLPTYYYQHTI